MHFVVVIFIIPVLSSQTVVTIDLDDMAYCVVEDVGFVTVCAVISDGCLERSVNVSLTTFAGSATGMSVITRII